MAVAIEAQLGNEIAYSSRLLMKMSIGAEFLFELYAHDAQML